MRNKLCRKLIAFTELWKKHQNLGPPFCPGERTGFRAFVSRPLGWAKMGVCQYAPTIIGGCFVALGQMKHLPRTYSDFCKGGPMCPPADGGNSHNAIERSPQFHEGTLVRTKLSKNEAPFGPMQTINIAKRTHFDRGPLPQSISGQIGNLPRTSHKKRADKWVRPYKLIKAIPLSQRGRHRSPCLLCRVVSGGPPACCGR